MPRIKLELPAVFPFSTDIQVRVTDVNYGGHLGNDSLLSFLQEARFRFFRSLGYSELDVEGIGTIMTDAAIVYKAEVFQGEVLRIDVAASDLQQSTCDLVYRVVNALSGTEVAHAKTGIAFFDYGRKKIVPMPEEFRAKVG